MTQIPTDRRAWVINGQYRAARGQRDAFGEPSYGGWMTVRNTIALHPHAAANDEVWGRLAREVARHGESAHVMQSNRETMRSRYNILPIDTMVREIAEARRREHPRLRTDDYPRVIDLMTARRCEGCSRWHAPTDPGATMTWPRYQIDTVGNRTVSICGTCSPQVSICECCHETTVRGYFQEGDVTLYPDPEGFRGSLPRRICQSCRDERYFFCHSCDEVMPNRFDDGDETDDGDAMCTRCANGEGSEPPRPAVGPRRCPEGCTSNHLMSYRFDVTTECPPDPLTLPNGRPARLFGCELEMAVPYNGSKLEQVMSHTYHLVQGDAIIKSDGSIHTTAPHPSKAGHSVTWDGFEMVTRPMTLDNAQGFFRRFKEGCHKDLRSFDPGSCGLHIHVSRASISPLTIGKLLTFLNDASHEQLIMRVAQRRGVNYARVKAKDIKDGRKVNADRYEMLNVSPPRTIEFRLYKGTMNLTRILACLQFTAKLIEWCERTPIGAHMDEGAFRGWLAKEPRIKELQALLEMPIKRNPNKELLDTASENAIAAPTPPAPPQEPAPAVRATRRRGRPTLVDDVARYRLVGSYTTADGATWTTINE